MRRLASIIGAAIGLALFASCCMASEINLIKLDNLKFLTPSQEQNLRIQIVMLAHFEARLENCGFKPNFERRAIAVVSACLTPAAIAPLVSYYRSQKEVSFQIIAESQNKTQIIAESQNKTGRERVDCSSDYEKQWLARVSKDIDNTVRDLDRMCRACAICGN
jgi:hypothetical protein